MFKLRISLNKIKNFKKSSKPNKCPSSWAEITQGREKKRNQKNERTRGKSGKCLLTMGENRNIPICKAMWTMSNSNTNGHNHYNFTTPHWPTSDNRLKAEGSAGNGGTVVTERALASSGSGGTHKADPRAHTHTAAPRRAARRLSRGRTHYGYITDIEHCVTTCYKKR